MKNILSLVMVLSFFFASAQNDSRKAIQSTSKLKAVVLGHSNKATVTAEELKSLQQVVLEKTGKDDNNDYTIVSYECSWVSGKKLRSLLVKGPDLNEETKAELQKLKSGSKIFFDNIKATDKSGANYAVPGVTLIIK